MYSSPIITWYLLISDTNTGHVNSQRYFKTTPVTALSAYVRETEYFLVEISS